MDNLTIVKDNNAPFITIESPVWGSVRGRIDEDGKVWFVGKDLASKLGYSDPSRALIQHCKKSIKSTILANRASGNPPLNITLIPESDVWRLVMRSNLPKAEEFQDWICEEVIPALHKAGTYTLPGARTAVPRDYLSALEALVAAERGRVALSNQLKVIEQKLNEVTSKLGNTVELVLPSWFNNLTGNMRIDIKDAKGDVWVLSHSTTGKTWVRKKKVF